MKKPTREEIRVILRCAHADLSGFCEADDISKDEFPNHPAIKTLDEIEQILFTEFDEETISEK